MDTNAYHADLPEDAQVPVPDRHTLRMDQGTGAHVVNRRAWWQRRAVWLGSGALVVLALAAGLLAHRWWRQDQEERARAPFLLALADLATRPATRYTTTDADGTTWDLQVSAGGHATGMVTVDGQRMDVLIVGGKVFMRQHAVVLAAPPDHASQPWRTDSTDKITVTLPQTSAPFDLARWLEQGLLDSATTLTAAEAGDLSVSGLAALKASTPRGDIYVSRTAPHRVLRYVPSAQPPRPRSPLLSSPQPTSAPSSTSTAGLLPAQRPDAVPILMVAAGSGVGIGAPPTPSSSPSDLAVPEMGNDASQLDLLEMGDDDIDQMYREIEQRTSQLADAVDTGVQLQAAIDASWGACSAAACQVNVQVSNKVRSSPAQSTNVTAQLTVSMTGEGAPVGGCTAQAQVPLNGSTTMSCTNVSPAWTTFYTRSQRTPGWHPYMAQAAVVVRAVATADVEKLVQHVKDEAERARCVGGTGSVMDAPVGFVVPSPKPFQDVVNGSEIINAARTYHPTVDAVPTYDVEADMQPVLVNTASFQRRICYGVHKNPGYTGDPQRLTSPQQEDLVNFLRRRFGWEIEDTKIKSKNQTVYRFKEGPFKGKVFTHDVDGHTGGTWKLFPNENKLRREDRLGTYCFDFSCRIGK